MYPAGNQSRSCANSRPRRYQPGVPALRKAYLKTTLQRTEFSAMVAQRVLEARERERDPMAIH
jgi:hypothetical protein